MSTKKHSPLPKPKRSDALSGRLSKSASELSCTAPTSPPPRARSAHHHTPLSVVHRTHHFFTNLKSRWQRSRSRERCGHATFTLAAPDSSGTEYGADQSSEQSTPANSPRHRIRSANHVSQARWAEIPKSHIPILDELMYKYLNKTPAVQNSISDLLFGDINTTAEELHDLDVNVLDHRTLKRIIEAEKDKLNESNHKIFDTRRQYEVEWGHIRDPKNRILINKIFHMMRQSVYTARYRLTETKSLRIRFKESVPYNIGIIVANVYQLILKCEHMYNEMWHFPYLSFFLWRIILYEKILACHTDVEDLVRRAYVYQASYETLNSNIDASDFGTLSPPSDVGGGFVGGQTPKPGAATPTPYSPKKPAPMGGMPAMPGPSG